MNIFIVIFRCIEYDNCFCAQLLTRYLESNAEECLKFLCRIEKFLSANVPRIENDVELNFSFYARGGNFQNMIIEVYMYTQCIDSYPSIFFIIKLCIILNYLEHFCPLLLSSDHSKKLS